MRERLRVSTTTRRLPDSTIAPKCRWLSLLCILTHLLGYRAVGDTTCMIPTLYAYWPGWRGARRRCEGVVTLCWPRTCPCSVTRLGGQIYSTREGEGEGIHKHPSIVLSRSPLHLYYHPPLSGPRRTYQNIDEPPDRSRLSYTYLSSGFRRHYTKAPLPPAAKRLVWSIAEAGGGPQDVFARRYRRHAEKISVALQVTFYYASLQYLPRLLQSLLRLLQMTESAESPPL